MGDFGYANARLRAMKGRLFGPDTYDQLLDLARVDDVIAHLAQSPYAPEIDAALARFSGLRVVLEGCRLHLGHTLHTIRGFFDPDDARLIHVLLARYDLHNIKTIVRGQQADAAPEDVLTALVPAGQLDDNALRVLVHEADPQALAELLRAWNPGYAKLTRQALLAWRESGDWQSFETTLDTSFSKLLFEQLGDGKNDRYVREYLEREIDAANLLAALRWRAAGVAEETALLGRRFAGGGQIARSWLVELAGQGRDDQALDMLRESRFAERLGGLERLELASAQRALDVHVLRFGQSYWRRDPLSIAPAIAYITAKRAEVMNVRLIAQGVALGLHRAEVERELIT